MMWRDVIQLISITHDENGMGDATETPTKRQVLANRIGTKRSEFYQAMANGLKPELTLEIKESEYMDESKLEYNGVEYNIIRTYPTKNECIEVVCNRLVNG